jgi:hypothetical protein
MKLNLNLLLDFIKMYHWMIHKEIVPADPLGVPETFQREY